MAAGMYVIEHKEAPQDNKWKGVPDDIEFPGKNK
jgi:hypothetical protein